MAHGVVIDCGDDREVVRLGGADEHRWDGADRGRTTGHRLQTMRAAEINSRSCRAAAPAFVAKTKRPGDEPGRCNPILFVVRQRRSPRKRSMNRNRLMKSR